MKPAWFLLAVRLDLPGNPTKDGSLSLGSIPAVFPIAFATEAECREAMTPENAAIAFSGRVGFVCLEGTVVEAAQLPAADDRREGPIRRWIGWR